MKWEPLYEKGKKIINVYLEVIQRNRDVGRLQHDQLAMKEVGWMKRYAGVSETLHGDSRLKAPDKKDLRKGPRADGILFKNNTQYAFESFNHSGRGFCSFGELDHQLQRAKELGCGGLIVSAFGFCFDRKLAKKLAKGYGMKLECYKIIHITRIEADVRMERFV